MEKFIKNKLYYEYQTSDNVKIIFTNVDTGDMAYQGENKNSQEIAVNRQKLASAMDCDLKNFVFAQQYHTDNITQVDNSDKGKGADCFEDGIENTDGLYTYEKDLVLATFHADCTPVYIYSKNDNFISVIHAGWQGTFKSIVNKALKTYINQLNLNPKDLKVIIGPSISKKSFEVRDDVLNKLKALDYIDYESCYEQISEDQYVIDIKRVNALQAIDLGILKENIYISDLDTCTDENFYSFRKNKSNKRMIACIVRK